MFQVHAPRLQAVASGADRNPERRLDPLAVGQLGDADLYAALVGLIEPPKPPGQ